MIQTTVYSMFFIHVYHASSWLLVILLTFPLALPTTTFFGNTGTSVAKYYRRSQDNDVK